MCLNLGTTQTLATSNGVIQFVSSPQNLDYQSQNKIIHTTLTYLFGLQINVSNNTFIVPAWGNN